jgi:hypothetical protein
LYTRSHAARETLLHSYNAFFFFWCNAFFFFFLGVVRSHAAVLVGAAEHHGDHCARTGADIPYHTV